MIVRFANPFDLPALIQMLKEYREQTPLDFLREADDEAYITMMLTEIIHGKGVALVAESSEIVGMIVAGIHPSKWSPKHLLLMEFAYWVKPEHRGTTAGHRLVSKYIEAGRSLKEQGRIANFFISKMVNSPDLKYDRFGFKKLEEFWVM